MRNPTVVSDNPSFHQQYSTTQMDIAYHAYVEAQYKAIFVGPVCTTNYF